MRRPLADRIRLPRVAGQQVSLAAASAEIAETVFTAPAGLRHPVEAAEAVECCGFPPYPFEAPLFNGFEGQGMNAGCRGAGQHGSVGRHRHRNFAPPAHAGFWEILIVIRENPDQFNLAVKARFGPKKASSAAASCALVGSRCWRLSSAQP